MIPVVFQSKSLLQDHSECPLRFVLPILHRTSWRSSDLTKLPSYLFILDGGYQAWLAHTCSLSLTCIRWPDGTPPPIRYVPLTATHIHSPFQGSLHVCFCFGGHPFREGEAHCEAMRGRPFGASPTSLVNSFYRWRYSLEPMGPLWGPQGSNEAWTSPTKPSNPFGGSIGLVVLS